MGPHRHRKQHRTPARQILDANIQYVIDGVMGLTGPRRTVASIARSLGVSKTSVDNRLRVWREKGLAPERSRGISDEDKQQILQLYPDLSIREIALKYDTSYHTVWRALRRWGVFNESRGDDDVPVMTLSELYTGGWVDVSERTIVTVNRKPRFILMPIGE